MFHRLLLALLIACLAIPAAAVPTMAAPSPCHETGMVMRRMDGHHQQEHKGAPSMATSHDCIGCIALLAGIGSVSEPGLLPATLLVLREALLIVRQTSGPDTPPPRA